MALFVTGGWTETDPGEDEAHQTGSGLSRAPGGARAPQVGAIQCPPPGARVKMGGNVLPAAQMHEVMERQPPAPHLGQSPPSYSSDAHHYRKSHGPGTPGPQPWPDPDPDPDPAQPSRSWAR